MPPCQQTQLRLLHYPRGCARRTPLCVHLQTGILPLGAGDATISTCPYRTQSEVEQQRACPCILPPRHAPVQVPPLSNDTT